MLQSCGVPFALARPGTTSRTWFDHNFAMRWGDTMHRHQQKVQGVLFHCFLYESNAEEFDQRVEGDGLRDIESDLCLARMWGPKLDCVEQLRLRGGIGSDSGRGSEVRNACWRQLLRHLRATVQASTILRAHALLKEDPALADAWTSGDGPIFPITAPGMELTSGASRALQLLPGKLAGIWAAFTTSCKDECERVYGTAFASFEVMRIKDSDECMYWLIRRVKLRDHDHWVLAELAWRDRSPIEIELLQGILLSGAAHDWNLINTELLPNEYRRRHQPLGGRTIPHAAWAEGAAGGGGGDAVDDA